MTTPPVALPDHIPSPALVVQAAREAYEHSVSVWASFPDEVPPDARQHEEKAIEDLRDEMPHLDTASLILICHHIARVTAGYARDLVDNEGDIMGAVAIAPVSKAYSHMITLLGPDLPAE